MLLQNIMAKYAAFHNSGHKECNPSPMGHTRWQTFLLNPLACTRDCSRLISICSCTVPLQNIEVWLEEHKSKHHRLGEADTNPGYHTYWNNCNT